MRSHLIHTNYYKKDFFFFFLPTKYKNEWKEREFWRQKKIKKINFYKNKKAFKIDDIYDNNILVSKEEPYGKKIHLNI